jgi:hypothetical protein
MVPPLQLGAMEPYLSRGEHVSLKVSDTLWIFTVQSLRTLMTKRLAHMCTQYQALSHWKILTLVFWEIQSYQG